MKEVNEEKVTFYRNVNLLLEIGTGFVVTILGLFALGIVGAIVLYIITFFIG